MRKRITLFLVIAMTMLSFDAMAKTIRLNKNGGSGGTDSVDSSLPSPIAVPTKSGCEFKGYYRRYYGDPIYGSSDPKDMQPAGWKCYYDAQGCKCVARWDSTNPLNPGEQWNPDDDELIASWGKSGSGGSGGGGMQIGDPVKVTFYDGFGGAYSLTMGCREKMPSVGVPTREGFTFCGYYDQPEGYTGSFCSEFYDASGEPLRLCFCTTLYAHWSVWQCGIYIDNDVYGRSWSFIAQYGMPMPSLTADLGYSLPTRTGYTFGGYWTGENGSGIQYYTASGESARTWDRPDTYMRLYPLWTANTYNVRLDQQGGSGGTTNVTVKYDSYLPTITVPTRPGYEFRGYWTEKDGGGILYYDASGRRASKWKWDSNITLYAKWTPVYTVTLDNQGGGGGTSSVTAKYGIVMPSITVPTRPGYAFCGYWTGKDGMGTQYYTASGDSARTWDIASATTLYAKWSSLIVTDVTAKQRYPWNGKVDITYTLTCDVAAGRPAWNRPVLLVSAKNRVDGKSYVAATKALAGDTGTAKGIHHVVWDLKAQGIEFRSDDVVFTVGYGTPKYCVIDLSKGANATNYPVSYLSDVPIGGWTNEHKTTKLVLRLIKPGSFRMCGQYDVTLTKPYYCGVFEVTQKQYELVTGKTGNSFSGGTLPLSASWNVIRGDSATYDWPSSTAVDPDSFVGRIKTRTGLDFELPTEAQWEYACRAGTTSLYNNGGSAEDDLVQLGRYNVFDETPVYSKQTAVGSFQPNAWGLYDMHGNLCEWCLDWYGELSSGMTDPVGSSSGRSRVQRGGDYYSTADKCAASYRDGDVPLSSYGMRDGWLSYENGGFRVVRNLSTTGGEQSLVSVAETEGDDDLYVVNNSLSVAVNLQDEVVVDNLTITWNAAWIGGNTNASVVIFDNGVEVMRATGAGEFPYAFPNIGRHDLMYTTYIDGVAQEETYSATFFKEWKYENEDGGAVIIGTTHTDGDVIIPSVIDGYPVTGIVGGAFAGCTGLASITIPSSVTRIDDGAFEGCTSLTQRVTLDQQGGSGGAQAVTATYGRVMPSITVPKRHGYTFYGYWTGKDGTGMQYYNASGVGTCAWKEIPVTRLYAHWIEGESGAAYCVIDLSAGTNAVSYPITYMATPPDGGFNTDEYKTTKLVLRLIEPGTFKMGGAYDVVLTKPFYCGIFEVTQKQYELVTGSNPSSYKGDMRPVEKVNRYMIRGYSTTCNWPGSTNVAPTSFVGKLQARTGLSLDLPTEAQWEYACRAGTTSKYNNGGDEESDLKILGRYKYNGGYSDNHIAVGSYQPNSWGLYDMHGNVGESCLDWFDSVVYGGIDPVGPSSGESWVVRGGSYYNGESICTSGSRDGVYGAYSTVGFRLVRTGSIPYSIVTFDVNGGAMSATNVTRLVAPETAVGTLPIPTREGYTFMGWWTSANGGMRISDSTVVTGNATCYAHWAPIYTVDFVTVGSTVAWSRSVCRGAMIGRLPVPARSGYAFAGWFTRAGTAIYTATKVTGDVTLYAHWTPGPCTVAFDAAGGTVEEPSRQVLCGTAVGALPVPVRRNFTFTGWYTKGGTCISVESIVSADVTLYAHWMHKVTFVDLVADGTAGVATWYFLIPHGSAVGVPVLVRDGYVFAGWYTKDGTLITEETKVTVDVTLYAHWTKMRMVTFDYAGGMVGTAGRQIPHGSAIGELPVPVRNGYMFVGWFTRGGTRVTSELGVTADVTLYARWVPSRAVRFDPNGGEIMVEADCLRFVPCGAEIGELPEPVRSGFVFDGWYTKAGTLITEESKVSADVMIYAHWMPEMHIVTFDTVGGTVGEAERQIPHGSAIGLLPVPVRSGYVSVGWFTRGGTRVTSELRVSADVTLYAHWTQPRTVAFDPNGGKVAETERQVPRGAEIGELPEPVRSRCLFAGWFTQGGTRVTSELRVSADVTLYAHWIPLTFGGDAAWTRESDGSWRSGAITFDGRTSASCAVTGSGTISFRWRVSSEYGYDYLHFYVDGEEVDAISGETDWMYVSYDVWSTGRHTFSWEYSEDYMISQGSDCGWIMDVDWTTW